MDRIARNFRTALTVLFLLAASLGVLLYLSDSASTIADNLLIKIRGLSTVNDRLEEYQDAVAERLGKKFIAAGLPYPPNEVTYLAFKDSRRLEVYSRKAVDQPWALVQSYSILGESGHLGPKLANGDKQVPEGIYRVQSLNPNSRFHLALRLNYPNDFDRLMAEQDGRTDLGGDIMIHGSLFSIGCLAMGDKAAEDLFVLTALVKKEHVNVIISPTDFRSPPSEPLPSKPTWTPALYDALRTELRNYKR